MRAAELPANGGTLSYEGASYAATLPDGDVVLVYTNTAAEGSFVLPKNAKARLLMVGGGGAGGSMAAVDEYGKGAGGGGGAGGVSDREAILEPGAYTVVVGRGGLRVQTIVQSWVGENGQNTTLYRDGEVVAAGKGGGGGGAVKVNGGGAAGGSGGGGSWFGDFQKGGSAVDGQGWAGGTPADESLGAGGGGAARAAADGVGRPDGTPGAGRTLDITGEAVVYGQGGRGGSRDEGYEPADGAGFGFGGDGAGATGRGGAGGAGICVIRIHKLFDYVRVDYPEAKSFIWADGATHVAFDPETVSEPLKSAIDYVEGTTRVTCSLGTDDKGAEVHTGVGRMFYAVHLKDEYIWNDGTASGSTSPRTVYWRVNEPGTAVEATVEVTKTVNWSEGNKATIQIDIHTTPEKKENIPNVLVLGSLCDAHELTADIVRTTLNTITEVGNVDYYYFNESTATASLQGSLSKGKKFSGSVTVKTSNHWTADAFYTQIWNLMQSADADKYDYVLFSFDRSRVVGKYKTTNAHEAEVAAFLKPYYEKGAVIWLVDNLPADCTYKTSSWSSTTYTIPQTPWYPCELYPLTSGSSTSWETISDHAGSTNAGYVMYKGLLGLFDPTKYEAVTQTVWNNQNIGTSFSSSSPTTVKRLAGAANPNQVVYDNAKNVAEVIANVVVAKPSTIAMTDAVYVESGLKLDSDLTRGQWTTNAAEVGWRDLTAEEFQITGKGVKLALPGILDACDVRLFVGVEDTGAFRSSVGATYNERTGKWEKDPNNGPVTVSVKPDGSETVQASAKATTAVAWSFPTYAIKGSIVHGEGEVVLNGFVVDSVDVAEGTSPQIVFRGKGGYVLDYLEVDGQVVSDFDPDLFFWYFENVGADHELKVGFKSLIDLDNPPATGPVTVPYDGANHGPTVTAPTFVEGYAYDWVPVYSTDPNGEFTPDGGVRNVVNANGNPAPQTVYVRLLIMQPGYENGVVISQWIGTNTVTVTPRELTVKFDDYAQTSDTRKETGFTYNLVAGSLVDGDELSLNPGRCTVHPAKGGKTVGSIVADGAFTVTTPDFDGNNYKVTVIPGDYYYPDLQLVAKAPSVTKVYDGKTAGTSATVQYPVDAKTATEESTSDGPAVSGVNFGTRYSSDNYSWKYNGTTYYHVTSNETSRIAKTISTQLGIAYSVDGAAFSAEAPSFVDVGAHTIAYRVDFSSNIVTRTTRTVTMKGNKSQNSTYNKKDIATFTHTDESTETIRYTEYAGTATITILPRPVTVTAGSAEKEFDGKPLTQAAFTVAAPTHTTGFVGEQGIASAPMTTSSAQTNPGSCANRIDQDPTTGVKFLSGTKPENYDITYVDGLLQVTPNPLRATANSVVKVYDGQPATGLAVTVVDSHGNPLPAGSYTVTYGLMLGGPQTETLPTLPSDAGEYPVFYTVNGGGYGTVTGVASVRITPRTVTLQAADAEKTYDGEPLTSSGFTVVSGQAGEAVGFVGTDGIAAVTMTAASTITAPGEVKNEIDVYDTEHWTMNSGTKVQNYTFAVLPGTLTVTRRVRYEVAGDGEFRWTDPADAKPGSTVKVMVDGKVLEQEYVVGSGSPDHVIHIVDETGADGAVHVVEFLYSDPYDQSIYVKDDVWTPSATRDDLYAVVNTDPPPASAEELQKSITVVNGPESGWMPVRDGNGDLVAVRSPDGTEGVTAADDLESRFKLGVVGTGEISIKKITVPVKGDGNPDNGALTIKVDGKTYTIPPVPDESVSYDIRREGDTVVIENLVIKVAGDSDKAHDIVFTFTRDADDPSGNTAATVSGIVWKTYGESDDGGTSWLQDQTLWIIDHEDDPAKRLVYLAFEPELKVKEELEAWVLRSSRNDKIKVKYGRTREEADAATPVTAHLSQVHEVLPVKVWIQVSYDDLDTVVEPVGYWRIYIEGSKPVQTGTGGGALQSSPGPQGAAPAAGAVSANTFGILKVESTTANTLIAVPWTWYSKAEGDAADIPVRKLVKTANIGPDDFLLAYTADGTYAAWTVDAGEWVPVETVKVDESATEAVAKGISIRDPKAAGGLMTIVSDANKPLGEQTRIPRGQGLWLCRKKPVDENGQAIPFWVYGQSVTTTVVTEIPPPADGQTVRSIMLGSPSSETVFINDLEFEGEIDANDHIWIPNGTTTPYFLFRKSTTAGMKWCYSYFDTATRKTKYVTKIEVKPGLGFWYDRRGKGALKVRWSMPKSR